jgi:hypothetical protein
MITKKIKDMAKREIYKTEEGKSWHMNKKSTCGGKRRMENNNNIIIYIQTHSMLTSTTYLF